MNRCKLLDLSLDDVVVVEGRWQTQDREALVGYLWTKCSEDLCRCGVSTWYIYLEAYGWCYVPRRLSSIICIMACEQSCLWKRIRCNRSPFSNSEICINSAIFRRKKTCTNSWKICLNSAIFRSKICTNSYAAIYSSSLETSGNKAEDCCNSLKTSCREVSTSGRKSPIKKHQRPTPIAPLRRSPVNLFDILCRW